MVPILATLCLSIFYLSNKNVYSSEKALYMSYETLDFKTRQKREKYLLSLQAPSLSQAKVTYYCRQDNQLICFDLKRDEEYKVETESLAQNIPTFQINKRS
jgi:5-methylcytosine-specific restriction endonuclease McrBC GTP-binding regulatory subunit McrB